MAGIRAVMVATPALLRDFIARLARDRFELEVVAEFSERETFERELEVIRPDVVVLGLHNGEADAVVLPLLRLLPAARFVVFTGDGRQALGYELRLCRTTLTDLAPGALIEFISGSNAEHDA